MKVSRGLLVSLISLALVSSAQSPAHAAWPETPFVVVGGQAIGSGSLLAGQIEECQAFAELQFNKVSFVPGGPEVNGFVKPRAWTQCAQVSDNVEIIRVRVEFFKNGTSELNKTCTNPAGSNVGVHSCGGNDITGDGWEFESGDTFKIRSYHRWTPTSGAAWSFTNTEDCTTDSMDANIKICHANTLTSFIIP